MTDETGTITLIVTMTVKPEQEAAFLKMTGEFIAWVHANEPDTLLYVLTKNADAEHTFTWVERYRDEAAFQAHGASDEIRRTRSALQDMLAGAPGRMLLHDILPV